TQGTLQAIFEFQTMICELTGMEVANASMYDGSTGAAEAILMAMRVTGRQHSVVARTVHPEYREVINTYMRHRGLPVTEIGYAESGRVDRSELERAITDDTACVLIQSPNFFGCIEEVAEVAEAVQKRGALLIVSIAEALSLGIVKPPAEADIVSLEAQSFGVPLGFGGPYDGVLACKEKYLRQMPGRLLEKTIIGGFPLKKFYPELGNAALWCCTELNTKPQIDAAVGAVQAGPPARAGFARDGVEA